MDPTKKRKLDENGFNGEAGDHLKLSPADARKIIKDAVVRHPDVLPAVRAVADTNVSQRRLFISGFGWDTTTDGLRSLFSTFGDLEEVIVALDKTTGKRKGYGFVTFRHVDGALLALREPSKRIDGRKIFTRLAADMGISVVKYVSNVPLDLPADRSLPNCTIYGENEEGGLF